MARVFYPSCTVALGVRFDEALHFIRGQSKTPTTEIARRTPPSQLTQSQASALLSSIPGQEPLFISSGNSDALSWLVNVVPWTASVTKPGFRDAGTFDVGLGFHALPFDPRLMKAVQVRVFFGCVRPEDFARGVGELVPVGPGRSIRVVRPSIIQGLDAQGHPDFDKLAVWGIADKGKFVAGDSPSLHLTGRDLRSLFISSPLRRGVLAKLDLTQPIDKVVKQIIESHPLGAQMQIAVQASDWPGGVVPSPGALGNVTAVHLGASGKKKGGPSPSEQESKLNYWMAIYNYCCLVGAVPYFRGIQLVIRPPAAFYDLRDKTTWDSRNSPFAGGKPRRDPQGRPFAIRKLLYGHNVSQLEFERSFQGPDRPRVIEVVCLDTSSKEKGKQKLLRAVYPKDVADQLRKKHVTKESPSGQLQEDEVQRVPVSGIRSQQQLEEVAKAVFETTSRYEVTGSFESKDLASYTEADGNDDPDMLRLAVGDPVELGVVPARLGRARADDIPIVSDLTAVAGMPFDEAVDFVAQQVGDVNFARALVATSRNLVVETEAFYRVSEVKIDWSKDSGAKVRGEFHNFIEARYGETGAPPTPSGAKATTARQAAPKTPQDFVNPNFPFDEG